MGKQGSGCQVLPSIALSGTSLAHLPHVGTSYRDRWEKDANYFSFWCVTNMSCDEATHARPALP